MNFFTISTTCLRSSRHLIFAILLCGLLLHSTSAYTLTEPAVKSESLHSSQQAFKKQLSDQWGIELTALRMTAAGRMIDFRYRVLDKEKAAPLHMRQTKPYLVHQTSGKVLAVPNTAKVGALRNSNMPQQGRIYWMFFGNNGVVQNGDKVSVVIGDFRADDLIVQ
jgi:hypothetical protein